MSQSAKKRSREAPVRKGFTKKPRASKEVSRRKPAFNEKNYVDLASANYECSTTGSITLLATIAQGNTQQTRVGKKIFYKYLNFRGRIVAGTTGTVADAAVIFVYDKRPTGALPAITDVLNTANSVSQNNADNEGRFRILARKDMVFSGNSATPTADSAIQNADFFIPMKQMQAVFKSVGTGAMADIEEGAVYMVTVANVATGTTAPVLTGSCRTRFNE